MTVSALVLPFPVLRRRDFVETQPICFRKMRPDEAEKYLRGTLRRHRGQMQRAGIDEAVIAREMQALEAAIRVGSAWVDWQGEGA